MSEEEKKIANYDKLKEEYERKVKENKRLLENEFKYREALKLEKTNSLAYQGLLKTKNKEYDNLKKLYIELQKKYDAVISPSEQIRMELK